MGWILIGAGSLIVAALLVARYQADQASNYRQATINACQERDRLNTENEELAKQLQEARKNEATWRTATGKVTADYSNLMAERDALRKENAALNLQLQEALKPRTRRKAGQAVNVGEDGQG